MKKKLQVFVSSTYTDLIEERQAAVSAILKAGHIPAGMELFTAGDESQMETINRWIDESDVFMLVLGGRYGSIEPISSLSYMELEYDYAVNSGMPYFAVVIDEAALEKKVREQGRDVIETAHAKELEAFRKKVLSRISAFFSNAQDIKLAVHETLSDIAYRYDLKGWVSGDEIPDIESFTDQINKLREENKRLTEDRAALDRGAIFSPSEDSDFRYIHNKLDRQIEINFGLYWKAADGKTEVKVGEEICRFPFLAALLTYVNKGNHYFEQSSLELDLLRRHKESPLADSLEIYRGHGEGIKELLALSLLEYGLVNTTTRQRFDRPERGYVFVQKLHRFKYWLEYNGYTVDDLKFECVPELNPPAQAGDPQGPDQSVEHVLEAERQLLIREQMKQWRTTEEGVKAAKEEVGKIFEELQSLVDKSNEALTSIKIDFRKVDDNQAILSTAGHSLKIEWICEDSTLEGSELRVDAYKAVPAPTGQPLFLDSDRTYTNEYHVGINQNFQIYLYDRNHGQHQSANQLAAELLRLLSNRIRSAD
jgi:hypothetical protein